MIEQISCWKATCFKCKHVWSTKTSDIPKQCPKCKTFKFNDDMPSIPHLLSEGSLTAFEFTSMFNEAKKHVDENGEIGNWGHKMPIVTMSAEEFRKKSKEKKK